MSATPRTAAATSGTQPSREADWTNEQMALFLVTLSQTGMLSVACEAVGMSEASAFALRRSPRGRAFAFGWRAAHLLARDVLEAGLLELRLREDMTARTPRGTVARRRAPHEKLAMEMLNRLERRAVDLRDDEMAIARSIAGSFEAFIELVSRGADAEALEQFLIAHPDPLAAQVAAMQRRDAEGACA